MKNYKSKIFPFALVCILFQQCTNNTNKKISDNDILFADTKQVSQPKIDSNPTDRDINISTSNNENNQTWQIIYLQKPGKKLSKIINNDNVKILQFILLTDNIKSYFYLNSAVEKSVKDDQTKNIDKYNTASVFRIFNENRTTFKFNLLDTTLYYYKIADENWIIESKKDYLIEGFSCKKAISEKFGTAFFSTGNGKIGGPNGICNLPGLVIKLITPENDEFLYSSATNINKKINMPITKAVSEEELDAVLGKIIITKNKTNTNQHTTVETKVIVSN